VVRVHNGRSLVHLRVLGLAAILFTMIELAAALIIWLYSHSGQRLFSFALCIFGRGAGQRD
jgi:hypothetical protein